MAGFFCDHWKNFKKAHSKYDIDQYEIPGQKMLGCRSEMDVNEAIIDVEIGIAEFEGRYYEGFMPVLGCPGCNPQGSVPLGRQGKNTVCRGHQLFFGMGDMDDTGPGPVRKKGPATAMA